jgi:hypothetical protein
VVLPAREAPLLKAMLLGMPPLASADAAKLTRWYLNSPFDSIGGYCNKRIKHKERHKGLNFHPRTPLFSLHIREVRAAAAEKQRYEQDISTMPHLNLVHEVDIKSALLGELLNVAQGKLRLSQHDVLAPAQ